MAPRIQIQQLVLTDNLTNGTYVDGQKITKGSDGVQLDSSGSCVCVLNDNAIRTEALDPS